jgi:hypothetical protein
LKPWKCSHVCNLTWNGYGGRQYFPFLVPGHFSPSCLIFFILLSTNSLSSFLSLFSLCFLIRKMTQWRDDE